MAETPEEAVKRKEAEAAAAREQDLEKKPSEGSGEEGAVDWKALLHIEREGRLKAERDRDNYREGLLSRKSRERQQEDTDPNEDDKPLTRKDLREIVEPILGDTKVDTILGNVVKDPAKRAYVRDLYENRIQRTGTSDDAIRSDLETALDLADSKKLRKENSELQRMNDNRTYVPPADGGGGGGGGNRTVAKAHEWSPDQEAQLEQRAQAINLSGEQVEKYKEKAWKEFRAGTAFAVKPKPKN